MFADADVVSPDQVALLLRPSMGTFCGDSPPSSFIVGLRGDEAHGRIVRHRAPSSAVWVLPMQKRSGKW